MNICRDLYEFRRCRFSQFQSFSRSSVPSAKPPNKASLLLLNLVLRILRRRLRRLPSKL